ncbi:MAG TPA: hypothetical protein VFZ21_28390 [Gemmatimonadaceae bacterium]|jgi:hypothetical protein|nr:hypothetical protein [Gemmatimonadaceae bacterium]
MNTSAHTIVLVAALALSSSSAATAQTPLPNDSLEIGRRYVRWFLTGQVDSLAAHMSERTLSALGGRDELRRRMLEVAARAGETREVVEERFAWRNGQRQYWHAVNTTALGEPLLVRIVISPSGEMTGLGLGPMSQSPPVDSGGPPIRKP